ncbi:MAG: non-heme iron oxygenase ferredoxin subunit [Acidimicrobiaceae bacterium]|nr:non-heme iron oxygenase ferredoxin subunit [Acidimicrobiaceae bacterium]
MTAITRKLFPFDEVAADSVRRVEVDEQEIAIVRIGDDVYAISDICSHANVSLSQGWVDAAERTIECPQHGAVFDVATGEALCLPAVKPIPVYDVAVVDGVVTLTLGTGAAQVED